MTAPVIAWLRRDLRLADQPALFAAAQEGPVIPVYVLDEERAGERAPGGAIRWWLHHSLQSLERSLGRHHSRLILRRGNAVAELCRIAQETGASSIHAIRHYEPWWKQAEEELSGKAALRLHDGNYLLPPVSVTTGSGGLYKIYTPFMKALMQHMPPADPLPEPSLTNPEIWPDSDDLADWGLLPINPDWAGGIREAWEVGEAAAHDRLGGAIMLRITRMGGTCHPSTALRAFHRTSTTEKSARVRYGTLCRAAGGRTWIPSARN